MTRFVGDAKGVSSRGSSSISAKERRKNMETYLQTGVHPQIEHAKHELNSNVLPPLPPIDINRPHVFVDLSTGGRQVGRIVVELFEDICPVAAQAFRNRCLEGHHTLKGTCIHKVQPHFAVFGGRSATFRENPVLAANKVSRLQHVDPGVVSTSHDGREFAITLARALQLNAGYQVVGRLAKCSEGVLAALGDIDTDEDSAPARPLKIDQCGQTDHRGTFETLSAANDTPQTAAEAVVCLTGELDGVRASLGDALRQGLKRKQGGGVGAQRKAPVRRKVAMELESESDSDDDGSDEELKLESV